MLHFIIYLQQNILIIITMGFSLIIIIVAIVLLQMIIIAANYLLKISLSPTLVMSFDFGL